MKWHPQCFRDVSPCSLGSVVSQLVWGMYWRQVDHLRSSMKHTEGERNGLGTRYTFQGHIPNAPWLPTRPYLLVSPISQICHQITNLSIDESVWHDNPCALIPSPKWTDDQAFNIGFGEQFIIMLTLDSMSWSLRHVLPNANKPALDTWVNSVLTPFIKMGTQTISLHL